MAQDKPVDPREQRIAELKGTLSLKEQDFAVAYIKCSYNGWRAVNECGHWDTTTRQSASVQASRMLMNANLRELVSLIAEVGFNAARISTVRILEHLSSRAFFDIRSYYEDGDIEGKLRPMSDWTEEEAAAVDGIVNTVEGYTGKGEDKQAIMKKELKMANADKALELLGKYHKLFSDMQIDIQVNLAEQIAKARKRGKASDAGTE